MKAAEERILRNPDLTLTEDQRYSYFHRATAEIRTLENERKQDLSEAKQAATSYVRAMAGGVRIGVDELDLVVGQLNKAGGQAESAKLLAAAARAEQLDSFNKLPLGEMSRQLQSFSAAATATSGTSRTAEAMQFFQERGWSPQAAAGIVGHLSHESGLNPNAVHDGGIGLGVAGWNRERLTRLKAFAGERGKQANDFRTQLEFVDHELNTTETRAAQGVRNAKTTDEAVTAFMHFERPQGYTPDNPTAGHGFANRIVTARRLAGGDTTDAPIPVGSRVVAQPGADLRLLQGQQKLINDRATATWQAMEKDMAEGFRPNASAVQDVIYAFQSVGNHGHLTTIGDRLDRFDAAVAAGRAPEQQQQAQITELERRGALGDLTPAQAAWKKDLETRLVATRKGLDENPINHTISNFPERFQTPSPLDPGNSAQFREGLAYRANIAQFAAQTWQVPTPMALDKPDVARLNAALEGASPDQKLRMFADMAASMPEDVYRASMEKLGNTGLTQFVGLVARDRPELARQILRGQDLMSLDKTGDKTNQVRAAFQQKIGRDLYPSAADQNNVTEAALAVYTARRGSTGTLYDATDKPGIEQAIEDVAGKITKRNGVKVAVPPGTTEGAFTTALDRVTSDQLNQFGGAYDLNGKPFAASFIGDRALLKQLGPGASTYVVGLPNATARDGFAPVMTYDGTPLVVDMKQLVAGMPAPALTAMQARRAVFTRGQAERLQETRREVLGLP
jgi:hypothetical protein